VYVLSDLTGPFRDVYAAVPRLKAHLASRSDSDSYLADRIGANTKVCWHCKQDLRGRDEE